MQDLAQLTKHHSTWTINVQLLILYVAATALFFVIQWGNLRVLSPFAGAAKAGKGAALLPVFLLAAGTSFIGVVTVVFLARRMSLVPPLAIIGLPLFLVLESHVRKLVADEDQARFQLSAAAGVLLGMASSVWIWMRHNPLV